MMTSVDGFCHETLLPAETVVPLSVDDDAASPSPSSCNRLRRNIASCTGQRGAAAAAAAAA